MQLKYKDPFAICFYCGTDYSNLQQNEIELFSLYPFLYLVYF